MLLMVSCVHVLAQDEAASGSEIDANLRSLSSSVDRLEDKLEKHHRELRTSDLMLKSDLVEKLNQLSSDISSLKSIVSLLRNEVADILASKSNAFNARSSAHDVYGVQELDHLTASVTKVVVSPKHDVTVFLRYESKESQDYLIALSGCINDWYKKSYLIDDAGNIYEIKNASGIGNVGCGRVNDPLLLKQGGAATYTIIFERPRSVDTFGDSYSISMAHRLGTLNADGEWRNERNFNVNISNLRPNK